MSIVLQMAPRVKATRPAYTHRHEAKETEDRKGKPSSSQAN